MDLILNGELKNLTGEEIHHRKYRAIHRKAAPKAPHRQFAKLDSRARSRSRGRLLCCASRMDWTKPRLVVSSVKADIGASECGVDREGPRGRRAEVWGARSKMDMFKTFLSGN